MLQIIVSSPLGLAVAVVLGQTDDGPYSRSWIFGLAIIVAAVLLPPLVGLIARRARRRKAERFREAAELGHPDPVPIDEEPDPSEGPAVRAVVAPSARRSRGGADPRVRGRPARPVTADRDDRDRTPPSRPVRDRVDPVPPRDESGDDMFRHPDFRGDD
jgi:hypothetical protein